MESVPEYVPEKKDYTEDPHYKRNLLRWNTAQVEEMRKPETHEKIAAWKGVALSEISKDDITAYWSEVGSAEWREVHKYDSNLFDYIGDERAAA